MIIAALIAFALAAGGGILLATFHLRNRPVPQVLGLGHGLIAITALVLLVIALMVDGLTTLAFVALGIFVLAALGGLLMLTLRLRGRPHPPAPIIAFHGAVAVTAFVLLLIDVVNRLGEGQPL